MNPTGAIYAPPGWGFVPGRRLDTPTAADMPDLPMLRFLRGRARNDAIVNALREWPELARIVRPIDINQKYAIAYASAHDILQRSKR